MSEERAERCETCRYWDCYDEGEPRFITRGEWREAFGLSNDDAIWTTEELAEMVRNDERKGDCKRRSPSVFDRKEAEDWAVWPVVNYWDWCGEWQPIGPDLRHVGTSGVIEQ